jgi:hypothetical protein
MPVVYNFGGSVRSREIIQLPCENDPRPGGFPSPWEWWRFESSGIRVGNKLCEKNKI